MKKDFSLFETNTGFVFKNKDLLREAFTHRSFLNESRERGLTHNERLEFLGDAVLELAVTDFLYKKYPKEDEGNLTAYRAGLVNANTLSAVAVAIGMDDFILLSRGEAKDKGKARQFILANAIEALIGALYLDQGYAKAEKFIEKYVYPMTEDIVEKRLWQDAKSFFQEKAQEEEGITPVYKVLAETGPDHNKEFKIGVYLGSMLVAEGIGKSKQEAEQEAAKAGLLAKRWQMGK
ncbi:ribonuclease III [bacterium]|nr:ribonuclease III [bacterium]